MGDTATMALSGHKKLQRAFRQLSGATQRRIVRRPLSAALTPISKAAKREVPKTSQPLKELAKAIGKVVRMYKAAVWGAVGIRTGRVYVDDRGQRHVPTTLGPLIEFGTEDTAAQSFLRSAFDKTRAIAFRILVSGITSNLRKEIAKAKK